MLKVPGDVRNSVFVVFRVLFLCIRTVERFVHVFGSTRNT